MIKAKINDVIDRIVDEFLSLINDINEIFELPELEVLHSRNTKVIQSFYRLRESMSNRVGKITNIDIKREAIIDYSCLPAMPNVLWGATNILEVSDVMEIENLKLAKKCFTDINFSALAFPYIPDITNSTSMYHGINEDKIYMPTHFFKYLNSTKANNVICNLSPKILSQLPWL